MKYDLQCWDNGPHFRNADDGREDEHWSRKAPKVAIEVEYDMADDESEHVFYLTIRRNVFDSDEGDTYDVDYEFWLLSE